MHRVIETLEELISLAMLLPSTLAADVRVGLAEACTSCRAMLIEGTPQRAATPASFTEASLEGFRPTSGRSSSQSDSRSTGLPPDWRSAPAFGRIADTHEPGLFVPDAFPIPSMSASR